MTFQSDVEPGVSPRMLEAFIIRNGGILTRQDGSHRFFTIDRPASKFHGRIVPCIDDNGSARVSRNHVAQIAGCFDRDRLWLLRQLGVQRAKHGKVSKGPLKQVAVPRLTKAETLDALKELAGRVAELASFIGQGQRDPAVYQRVHEAAVVARRALDEVALFGSEVAS